MPGRLPCLLGSPWSGFAAGLCWLLAVLAGCTELCHIAIPQTLLLLPQLKHPMTCPETGVPVVWAGQEEGAGVSWLSLEQDRAPQEHLETVGFFFCCHDDEKNYDGQGCLEQSYAKSNILGPNLLLPTRKIEPFLLMLWTSLLSSQELFPKMIPFPPAPPFFSLLRRSAP